MFTWQNSTSPLSYTVYLDENVHVENVQEIHFLFNNDNTPFGEYNKVGVQAHYITGTSEIVTLNQPFEICNSMESYEVNYSIYPNPATNSLTVERSISIPVIIELYNAMGMRINQYETSETKFEINIASLATGTYFIRVIEGDKIGVKSFVKK